MYFFMGTGECEHWVNTIEAATLFKTEKGAKDASKYQPSCKGNSSLEIKPIAENDTQKVKPSTIAISAEEAQAAFDNFTNIIGELKEGMQYIDSLISHYNQELSRCDLMEQDILHKIEFDNISGLMAVKLVKKLKEIRIARRECKDKIDFFHSIKIGGANSLIKSVTSYNTRLENRSYSVRYLTDIFNGKAVVK